MSITISFAWKGQKAVNMSITLKFPPLLSFVPIRSGAECQYTYRINVKNLPEIAIWAKKSGIYGSYDKDDGVEGDNKGAE